MKNKHEETKFKNNIIPYMNDYASLQTTKKTTLNQNAPLQKITLTLTGNMARYIWSFNDTIFSQADKIFIKKGENVQITLINKTMMHHPIHLHGHFFRVLNGQGEYSPLKHTVNVPSMKTVTIEFAADQDKDWFFHCHNLYHMKSGMARVIAYQESTPNNAWGIKKLSHDNWYSFNDTAILSNMIMGRIRSFDTLNGYEIEFDSNYKKEYDIDAFYAHNFTVFLNAYTGVNLERQKDKKLKDTAIFGIRYMLPMLVLSDLRVDSKGRVRFELSSGLQLTSRCFLEWEWNTDKEYRFLLSYEFTKKILVSAVYDSDFKWGGGLRIRF